ncbi:MAG: hypothetical protein ACRDTF_04990 [Pseudonocardiaceae bacterium]
MLEVIATIPVPVIAAVHGVALGAGTQLAIASDPARRRSECTIAAAYERARSSADALE